MADPKVYESALCTVNGALLIENTSIQVEYIDQDKIFPLLDGSLANQPSGRRMRISVGEAVSTKGFAFDWIKNYIDVTLVTFGVVLLGSRKRLLSKGYLTAPGLTVAVAQNSSFKVGFIGTPSLFQ